MDNKYLENLKKRVKECTYCSDVGFCWNVVTTDEILNVINALMERQTKE